MKTGYLDHSVNSCRFPAEMSGRKLAGGNRATASIAQGLVHDRILAPGLGEATRLRLPGRLSLSTFLGCAPTTVIGVETRLCALADQRGDLGFIHGGIDRFVTFNRPRIFSICIS